MICIVRARVHTRSFIVFFNSTSANRSEVAATRLRAPDDAKAMPRRCLIRKRVT